MGKSQLLEKGQILPLGHLWDAENHFQKRKKGFRSLQVPDVNKPLPRITAS